MTYVRVWEIKIYLSHRRPQILDDPLPKQESELSQISPFVAYHAARLLFTFPVIPMRYVGPEG